MVARGAREQALGVHIVACSGWVRSQRSKLNCILEELFCF